MNTMHPDESAIQLFAVNPAACSVELRQHITACPHCQANAELYTQLFSAVKKQPAPAFDFDISALVIARLPEPKTSWSAAVLITCLLCAAVIFTTGWFFRKELLQLFAGLVPAAIYLAISIPMGIALFQGIELFRKYNKLFSAVNQ